MHRGQIVPADHPFATGHCFYCDAEVVCDDAHAERSLGQSWRLRCDACRDAGANHQADLAAKLARAIRANQGGAMFTTAQLDRIEREAQRLAADPALDGYVPGYPTWGLLGGHELDVEIAATSQCHRCGHYGRGHAGFVAADGSSAWRGFAICPQCGQAEEF
jgi:hypothetical protein